VASHSIVCSSLRLAFDFKPLLDHLSAGSGLTYGSEITHGKCVWNAWSVLEQSVDQVLDNAPAKIITAHLSSF
jgi:hypothetical protein